MPSPSRPKPIRFQLTKLSAAVAMAMLFSNAGAAGWGDLTVLSSLGQPLRADIELISTSPQDDGALTVKLASVDTYRQANIEFNPVLMSLRFAVEQRGQKHVVRVTSTQPVNEPFVDLLLELGSSSGRVVREYVFLLDPAIDDPQKAMVTPADDAVTKPSKTEAAAAPATRKPASPAGSPARVPAPVRQAAPKSVGKPGDASTARLKPRLSLSGVTATSATDDKAGIIALDDYTTMEKQVAESNARVKALEQRVTELQKLLEVTNNLLAELQKQNEAAKTGAIPAVPPAATTPVAPAPAATQSKPVEPVQPISTAAAPAPAIPKPAAPPPLAPPPEEETDYLIPGAAVLVAMLGAAGLYTNRRRKAHKAFEASRYDDAHRDKATTTTGAGDAATTALATGLLLPTGHGHTPEVDPLAEADVYIAYGRDVQAEDILKEALHKEPDRHPVRVKLLSIYAGRRDRPSFDALALELHHMTKGTGKDWEQAAELGRDIDPANSLYAAQVEPALVLERIVEEEPPVTAPIAPAQDIPLPDLQPTEEISPVALAPEPDDIDADLDGLAAQAEQLPAVPPVAEEARAPGPGPIDFDFIKPAEPLAESLPSIPELSVPVLDEPKADGNLMDFDFLKQDAKDDTIPELPQAMLEQAKPAEMQEEALLDFDFLKPQALADGQPEDGVERKPSR